MRSKMSPWVRGASNRQIVNSREQTCSRGSAKTVSTGGAPGPGLVPAKRVLMATKLLPRFVVVVFLLGRFTAAEDRQPEILTNSIGMQLVRIPAGEFLMGGSEPAEELCKAFASYDRKPEEFNDEYPQHKVRITKPYLMG